MIGGDGTEGGPEQGVMPGGIDFQTVFTAFQLEAQAGTFGTPDPVMLHQPDPVGPAFQPVEGAQQFFGIVGDLQEPLGQLALFNQSARAPAPTINDLFVGKNRILDRIPVDPAFLAIDQIIGQEIEEHLLFVAIITRFAGRQFTVPVIGQAH